MPLPDPHAIVPSSLPPLYVIFGRGSPSAAVWSIPHRGYCSSFLINYFRQKKSPAPNNGSSRGVEKVCRSAPVKKADIPGRYSLETGGEKIVPAFKL